MSALESGRFGYPPVAEQFWVRQAEVATELSGDLALERLMPYVGRLSDLFTTERPEKTFPDYFAEQGLLAGYGVFFLPQSFTRTSFALSYAMDFRGWRPPTDRARILDLGSGPGSCGVSVAHRLLADGARRVSLHALDKSPSALVALENFAESVLGEKADVSTRAGDASRPAAWPEETFDVIVAGFVLNELKELDADGLMRWVTELKRRLHPEGLLIILEPALRVTSERLQRLSDRVAAEGLLTRLGPDLDALPCPQLAQGLHWTHEARRWTAPVSTEFVNRKLHRDLREVRFSFALFSNQVTPPVDPAAVRVVSDVQMIKGMLRFIGIQQGALQTVEVPTRGLSKHAIKLLAETFERGDIIAHAQPPSPRVRLSGVPDLRIIYSVRA
ncbi:MAG: class I SAM-dependent methyltransferase [Verrucomicrobiota bacterium]